MLQSIQYGSGPPLYVYSNKSTGWNNGAFQVFASRMVGEEKKREQPPLKRERKTNQEKEQDLLDCYEKEYREREKIRWK